MEVTLHPLMRDHQDAQAEFHESIQSFETDLKNIRSAMTSSNSPPSQSLDSPIPPHLRSLESHASEMAALLDSLVQHFDVCVNAIKHTEGGFAAVKQAASNNQLPDGVTVSGVIPPNANDGTDSGNLEPISEDERRELLTVLANDAAEVEDVVQELHHRLASMEEQHEAILDHVASLNSSYTSTTKAFTLLEAVGSRLPSYIVASSDFQVRWGELKSLIGEQMEELESMRVFYEGYMASYDGLIGEVARRNQDEERMKSVLRKAMEQVRKIHDADSRAREGFRKDVGEFLPSDLWPGLVADAPKYEVGVVGEEEDESSSTPELDKQVVEAAAKREKERQK